MRSLSRALVVMAKLPKPGRVKTRMTPPYSPEQAALLYTAFLKDVMRCVREAADSAGADPVLYVGLQKTESLDDVRSLLPKELEGWRLGAQPAGNLGDRLEAARAFCGADEVLIVGSDSPHMQPQRLVTALESLQDNTVVVGPTEDGGYDAIALRKGNKGPWDNVPWSTPDVLAATRALVQRHGQTLVELDVGFDLDDMRDLQRLIAQPELQAPCTREVLATLKNVGFLSPATPFCHDTR